MKRATLALPTGPAAAGGTKRRDLLYRLLLAVSAITVASGLGQVVMPGVVLGLVGGAGTPAALHFFGIIGMFMVLFGGLLLHTLLGPHPHPVPILWAGLQKLGAAVAVGLGVARLLLGPLALLVAGFDLVSALLIFWYLRRRTHEGPPGRSAGAA